jgi:hypothetical protein
MSCIRTGMKVTDDEIIVQVKAPAHDPIISRADRP